MCTFEVCFRLRVTFAVNNNVEFLNKFVEHRSRTPICFRCIFRLGAVQRFPDRSREPDDGRAPENPEKRWCRDAPRFSSPSRPFFPVFFSRPKPPLFRSSVKASRRKGEKFPSEEWISSGVVPFFSSVESRAFLPVVVGLFRRANWRCFLFFPDRHFNCYTLFKIKHIQASLANIMLKNALAVWLILYCIILCFLWNEAEIFHGNFVIFSSRIIYCAQLCRASSKQKKPYVEKNMKTRQSVKFFFRIAQVELHIICFVVRNVSEIFSDFQWILL